MRVIIKQLRQRADALRSELNKTEMAIKALGGLSGRSKMSASARARIGAAQRKRWAKWKAGKK
jgi:hypothetical protein